jgi:Rrf2 family protein
MKLSLRAEYALRALVALGEDYSGDVVPINSISVRQEIPKRFLEQILNDLKAGGFVESKRGIAGGYRLARPPEEIPLAPIVQHVEGKSGSDATEHRERVPRHRPEAEAAQSAIGGMMREVNQAMAKVLEGLTIADLCERAREARSQISSSPDYAI